jgi:hypothetical protein
VTPIQEAAVRGAVTVAARHGITAKDPAVLADGANIVVHLRPAPVVAKVAASTLAVRRNDQEWLQRELDVSAFLAARGAPVVPPSPELPATTHRDHDHGHLMSFWLYLPPADPTGTLRPDEETIGSMLRDLHAALRRYPETLPTLAPLQDIPAFLARPQSRVSRESKAALAAAYDRLTAELDGPRRRGSPARPRNQSSRCCTATPAAATSWPLARAGSGTTSRTPAPARWPGTWPPPPRAGTRTGRASWPPTAIRWTGASWPSASSCAGCT